MSWGAVAGAALGAISSAFGAHEANKAQERLTKELYQNRYQWQVADMRKAGLNPILAASGGGLAAPSVSAPQVQNVMGDASKYLEIGVNSAIAERQARIAEKEADTHVFQAETEKFQAETARNLSLAQIKESAAKTALYGKQGDLYDSQTGYYNILGRVTSAKGAAEVDEIRARISNEARKTDAIVANLASGSALNYAQIGQVQASVKKMASEMKLTDLQAEDLQRDLDKLDKVYDKEVQETLMYEVLHKLSVYSNEMFGILPFDNLNLLVRPGM